MSQLLSISNEEYDQIDAARSSFLKKILQSPAHAVVPTEQTPAMARGVRTHDAVLQPDRFERYVVSPKFDRRTKEGKAASLDFEMSNQGREIIDQDDYDTISGCVHSVWAHPRAKELLSDGKAELSALWVDAPTGIACKARPDFMPAGGGVVVDVKTTQNASPGAFSRQVANLKYHMQAAFYLDGVSQVTGITHEAFMVVAVETAPPFAVAVYKLDFGTLEKGRALYREALERYAQCKALNEWPGYSTEIQTLAIPPWAFNEGESV